MAESHPLSKFGANLRATCEQRGLSQEALAQRLEWIRQRSGDLRVPVVIQAYVFVARLARALGVKAADILSGID